jgi:hypothetical protein
LRINESFEVVIVRHENSLIEVIKTCANNRSKF